MPVRSRSRCCSAGDVLLAAVAQVAQLIELRVVARRGSRRRRPAWRAGAPSSAAPKLRREIGAADRTRLERGASAVRSARGPARPVERLEHVGQPQERIAQRAQLARRGAAGGGAAGQALEVAHAVECLAEPRPRPRRSGTATSTASSRASIAAGSRSGESTQWRSSRAPIGVTVRSIVSSSVALRAPARSGSTSSRLRRVISSSQRCASLAADGGTGEVRQPAGLELGEIAEQGARGADAPARPRRPTPRPSSEASQKRRRELLAGELGIELPALARGAQGTPSPSRSPLHRRRSDHLGRSQAARVPRPGRRPARVSSTNSPVVRSMAARPTLAVARRPQSPPPSSCCARRRASSPRSIAPGVTVSTTSRRTMPLAELGILHLLADGDAMACRDELAQILGRRLDRHAGEGHAVAARGERDARARARRARRRRRTSRRNRPCGRTGSRPGAAP